MPAYDKAFFLERFGSLDTDELLEHAIRRELTEEAKLAIREILLQRGVDGPALELRFNQVAKSFYRRSGVTNQCDLCGKTSLAPLHDGNQKFCSRECLRNARLLEYSVGLPPDLIVQHAWAMRVRACPACGRNGSIVEMRPTYLIASLIWFCWRETKYEMCCARCSKHKSLQAVAYCFLLGWWSLWGLFATPVRIARNLHAAFRWRIPENPSPQLMFRARLELAESLQAAMAPRADSVGPAQ
jgi:ADP-ribose pyrophosphatase YjhB (NUDIX family)